MLFPFIKPVSLLGAAALAAGGTVASVAVDQGPMAPQQAQAATRKVTASKTRVAAATTLAKSRVAKTPYRYGGTSLTRGADCSGFTQRVFANKGVKLPRTAAQQRAAVRKISRKWLRPGDLVFFGSSAYHMGIYVGNGQIVDAPSSGRYVSKRKIWTSDVTYGTLRPAV
ncbi:C40 family peptidase [Kribbia dieselivorans]|uniref:C40 family peptidase n=1 Tax=Kribbia dieselivorans TaxID=331526 RepID=UPI000838FCC9|nr:C40 family peptidase [Kribbia dieselivorans]